jgi:hypothetical protein
LQKRGIKRSKSTVARYVKRFIERERKAFEIGVWVDEMDDAFRAVNELTARMHPERERERLDAIYNGIATIKLAIQPWALEQARSAGDTETLARLVRLSSEYFAPAAREDKPKNKLEIVR